MKTCSSCRQELPLESFHRASARSDGRQRACKACNTATQRAVPVDVRRDRWLQRTYGLSLADFEKRAEAQGGACRICNDVPTDKPLVVDHDHACCPTSKSCGSCIRGLICDPCNRGLGFFRDNPERLIVAANYIKESNNVG